MSDLTGKVALVVGVANKRSLAWAIAQALDAAGAELILAYQGERLKENVEELAVTLTRPAMLVPCDVTVDEDIASLAATITQHKGGLDMLLHGVAFAPREALADAVLEDVARVVPHRARHQRLLAGRALERLCPAHGRPRRRQHRHALLPGATRAFPNYNVMGVAKAALESCVRYLASDLGPQNIRVNAISAGPVRTLASAGVAGFTSILGIYRDRAPLRRNIDQQEVADAAVFLLGPAGRGISAEVMMVDAGISPSACSPGASARAGREGEPSDMRVFRQWSLLVTCLALSSLIRAQPAIPVVRSGVDLVLIDAVILDDDGHPIRDLQPSDIDVRVDGIARPVQWMQPIGGTPSTEPSPTAAPVRPPAGETQAPVVTPPPLVPRWFVVVVDRESIAAGGGQALLDAAGSLIEGLPAGDRVAVWVTPSAARSLQFKTPRDVLARTVRASTGLRGRPNTVLAISPDEGLAILDGDMQLLADVTRRECVERGLGRDLVDCGGVARREAEALGRETRDNLRVSLDTLQAIVGALGPLDGPKHVVMVSGPMAAGKEETRWLGDIERIANASRLTIHSLLTTPTVGQIIDAESRTSTLSLSLATTMHASAAAGLAGATGRASVVGRPARGDQAAPRRSGRHLGARHRRDGWRQGRP